MQSGLKQTWRKSTLAMDTEVRITVLTSRSDADVHASILRAFQGFHTVERVCSRFAADSELSRLSQQIGRPVPVSDLLFQAVRFALAMADATDGAFDPTIGRKLESFGFNRHYLTGEVRDAGFDPDESVSYRDVTIGEEERTVLLRRPMVIDLGAVAKGLAVDLAARELTGYEGFVVDAGGDIYAGGLNEREEPWHVGIRHPLRTDETIASLRLTDMAVCTSGSYERRSRVAQETHHLIDPRTGTSRSDLLSCTVLAPHAMMADAMSTAAFILGTAKGMEQVEAAGLNCLFIDATLALHMTGEMARYII